MQLRKLANSVSEGDVTLEGLTVEVDHGVFKKFMSSTLAYGTVLTDVGRPQYAFFSVTVSESLCLHPASMAHSDEATWEQLSPRLAMQSQWADGTLPEFSHST